MGEREVAIIGMACIFPKAPDLETFWRNIRDGVDAITDVPAERWDPQYYDPTSTAPDRFYARRGGFIDEYAEFDAAAFGIMPIAARGAEPDQLIALKVAAQAMKDAGYDRRVFNREATSVILGRGNYLGPGIVRLVNITRGAEQLVDSLRRLLPEIGEAKLDEIKKDFQGRNGVYGPDTAIGLVPNLVASRIANRLDLGGSAYTIDAACASTLVAVDQACRELRDGQADMVIAGGVHLCHDPAFWSVFSQLGALSRTEQIRPFNRDADGLLIGEGVGMVILKRLSDAKRDEDRIYAVIRGTGVASDGRDVSIMTPRVEGQVLALKRAWEGSGLDPHTVGLVEAHGTATVAGDSAELETLSRVFGPPEPGEEKIPIGSIKSMIGHTMPAAGAAGLIKAALAVYHGILPPTLHCEEPNPALEETRFRAITASEAWEATTRRAAVNAFGFGGINAHVIIDSLEAAPVRRRGAATAEVSTENALILAAPSQAGLLEALDHGYSAEDGPFRLAVFDPTPARLQTARKAIEAGRARHGRDGIFFSPRGLLTEGGKLAVLFPGVEANFGPEVEDVAAQYNLSVPMLDGEDLEGQGLGVFLLNSFMHRVLGESGVKADVLAGHSVGEWSGMQAAGFFKDEHIAEFVSSLESGTLQTADLAYVAVGTGADRLRGLIEGLDGVEISHDNCLHQSIAVGTAASVEPLEARLRENRILYEVLPFKSGFHSSSLAGQVGYYKDHLDSLDIHTPATPLWSATTCEPYPHDPDAVKALFLDHLVKPVRFRELVLRLYDEGVRVFVQAGQGSLTAFVDDSLTGKPHNALSLVMPQRPGMAQVRWALASLFVEGAAVDLQRAGLSVATRPQASRALKLELGVPLIALDLDPLRAEAPALDSGALSSDPLVALMQTNLRELQAAQASVVRAAARLPVGAAPSNGRALYLAQPAPPVAPPPAVPTPTVAAPPPEERKDEIELSLDTYPELIDHSLFPQPPGWPHAIDRGPTVPMTMSIALMRDAARRMDPGMQAIAVENVTASTWLYVEPGVKATVTSRRLDAQRIRVKIGNYVEGTVVMAPAFPEPPAPADRAISEPGPSPVRPADIYTDHWLFHGPRYQGIQDIDAFGTDGLRGTLISGAAKGSLLDNAGQLGGLWIMLTHEADRLAMPVRIPRVEFFGPDPEPGDEVTCSVWFNHIGRREVRFDLEMVTGGRVYCKISNWEDWRFPTGGGLFALMLHPDRNLLARSQSGGFVMLNDPGWTSTTFEFLVHRFFSTIELEGAGGARQAQRQADWLNGRIAAKDAVRKLLFERGHGPMFPIEVTVKSEPSGRPVVSGPFEEDIRVSIAHKDGTAVAMAAIGVDIGIDIEKVEPRSDSFAALAFTPDELKLLPAGADRDEWLTRFWSAKEAAGKAAGTGLAGNPKGILITGVTGDSIQVAGKEVQTRRTGEYVVAWTVS